MRKWFLFVMFLLVAMLLSGVHKPKKIEAAAAAKLIPPTATVWVDWPHHWTCITTDSGNKLYTIYSNVTVECDNKNKTPIYLLVQSQTFWGVDLGYYDGTTWDYQPGVGPFATGKSTKSVRMQAVVDFSWKDGKDITANRKALVNAQVYDWPNKLNETFAAEVYYFEDVFPITIGGDNYITATMGGNYELSTNLTYMDMGDGSNNGTTICYCYYWNPLTSAYVSLPIWTDSMTYWVNFTSPNYKVQRWGIDIPTSGALGTQIATDGGIWIKGKIWCDSGNYWNYEYFIPIT